MALSQLGQRVRRPLALALATALALALGAGFGVSTGRADVGGVYFDDGENAAAGDPLALFNDTFTGLANVGLARSVMPNLTDGSGKPLGLSARGEPALAPLTPGAVDSPARGLPGPPGRGPRGRRVLGEGELMGVTLSCEWD